MPDLIELCQIAKATDPRRLVGAGGYDHVQNQQLGRAAEVDVLLFDTAGPEPTSGELSKRFLDAGITDKPCVNVELFGAWPVQFKPQGVFPQEAKLAYLRDVQDAASHAGLSVFFHNNLWCQPTPPDPVRDDLGGSGTPEDLGIGWYFAQVQALTQAASEREVEQENFATPQR